MRMKEEGEGSKAPLTDSFLRYPNNKYVLLALLGATAGQGVVWYTGQFYALFFLLITLKLDFISAYMLIGLLPDHRNAVLHRVRLVVGPDRPLEDHPGGVRDRRDHLLPAVCGTDALRQPGPRGVRAEEPDHHHRRPVDLQLPHLRGTVVELHPVRSGARTS